MSRAKYYRRMLSRRARGAAISNYGRKYRYHASRGLLRLRLRNRGKR